MQDKGSAPFGGNSLWSKEKKGAIYKYGSQNNEKNGLNGYEVKKEKGCFLKVKL
ncbi:hypothetical protein K7I13_11405 [Brucepastera parasyntrophica]|uniref:hypothetical protein n=1 Tax=Brucepastera parasyntrophica TaxID=2880008 RepID=UPI00210E4E76|nr:hypothetical protein [Brucepastera parasyntrophica]ULQ59096.1 hypothetical protein K7I13_11340 [Brucepastera parasyntrophica]ULQ59107.1 hypothetical protein K7I13_11405 [Brucepastera parasyntrophica]